MKVWPGLRPIVLILLALAVVEGLVWLALRFTSAEMIIPQPETIAAEFSQAMTAHRWQAALDLLSEEQSQQVTEQDLMTLMDQIEQQGFEIEHIRELDSETQADQATALTRFTLTGQETVDVEFNLARESHLWKITSFEGLKALATDR